MRPRRTAAALACVAVLATATSCAHRRNGIIVASVGAVGVVAAALAIRDCKDNGGCGDGLILALPVAVAVTIGGLLGAATAHSSSAPLIVLPDRPPQRYVPPVDAAPAEPLPDAAPATSPPPDAAPAPAPAPDAGPASIPLSPNRIP